MGSAIRFTGLSSGLDTESIVKAIMTPYQTKIDKLNKNQVLAEWRKDAYKEMSTKIQNFRNNAVSKLKYASDLNKAKAEMSQQGVIKIDTSTYKEDGTHKIEVKEIAQVATVKTSTIKSNSGNKLTKEDLVTDIKGMPQSGSLTINGETFSFDASTKISDLETMINERFKGQDNEISFKFDSSSGAFLINTTNTGASQQIDFGGTDMSILNAMGVQANDKDPQNPYKYTGENAEVIYNSGITINSETNDIEVNGIKFTATSKSAGPMTVTISKDVDAVVDTVKNFVDEYNKLLKEINGMLYADSAKGYEPLTDEEKKAMSEKEVEKWEEKIKGSLLRNDSTLRDLASTLRDTVSLDYSIDHGLDKDYSMLAQLGIKSNSWKDKGNLTLDEDKLRVAISENGDAVTKLFTTIANNIEKELNERSTTTELRSYGQYFNDKIQTTNISNYKSDIIKAQAKYDKLENMYYKKFTAMETAMSKLNSQSSLFGSL